MEMKLENGENEDGDMENGNENEAVEREWK